MGEVFLSKLKNVKESYDNGGVYHTDDGTFIGTYNGKYAFDKETNTLNRGITDVKEQTYKVIFSNSNHIQLVAQPKQTDKSSPFIITYERI
jgi:hypothetical protein